MNDRVADVDGLERAIFAKKPVLEKVLTEYGEKPLSAYAHELPYRTRAIDTQRQDELVATVSAHVKSIFGPERAESAVRQLKHHYYASTTDHHGPLTHPFFVHANLMAASPYVTAKDPDHENLIVLACSNTSLGNSSWPRGLVFNGNASGQLERVNFFPSADRARPVFKMRAYDTRDMRRVRTALTSATDTGGIAAVVSQKLDALLGDIYEDPAVFGETTYARQITRTNSRLWERFFVSAEAKLPHLLYLEQEAIVIELLQEHHVHGATELSRFIFDASVRSRAIAAFDGIPGAFSTKARKGTFLFWLVAPETGMRIALWPEGDRLVSLDRLHEVLLEPSTLAQLMKEGRLIPSMMLSLMTLSSYYGLKCLGGFSQVDYLTRMEGAYARSMDVPEFPDDGFTRGFCGDLVIGAARLSEHMLAPVTGIDLALHCERDSGKRFSALLDSLTLRQSFGMMLPELYRILYRPEDRERRLESVTQHDLMEKFEKSGVLKPLIEIPA